jgi:hypothetical protein
MRLRVGLAMAWALAGCAPDYTALHDWSAQARDAMLPLDMPRVQPGPPAVLAPPPPVTQDGREGAVLALREGIATWLGYLALLAEDVRPPVIGSSVEALAPKVEPFDPDGAAALLDLGRLMDYGIGQGWRQVMLPSAVDLGDAYVQRAIAALRREAALLASERGADPQRVAARIAILDQIAAGFAMMKQRSSILAQSETARMLRAQESELRRLILLAAAG